MKKNNKEKNLSAKCARCYQDCCRYITEIISPPRTIYDFDGLLWQLYHKNVILFRDSSGWHLLIYNPCVHLKKNGKCAIYENRPITCREHSSDYCEHDNPIEKAAIQYFGDYKSLENYCRKKFKTWDRRFLKK